jgi:tetratricopeptide (TPR) repeat protein
VSRLTALLPALVRAEANNGNNAAALDAARRLLEISIATNTGVGEAHALLGAALVGSGHLEEGITELESAWHLLKDDRRSEADAARPHLIHNLIVAHANAQRLAQVWPDLAERAEQLEPTLATEALEVLGLQMLSQRDIPETDVAALLVRAVRRRKPADRAWTAATLAAQATDEGANHVAVELLNLALTTAARRKQETTLRHIRNDLALALTRTRNHQRARSLLNTNLTNADADDDSRTQWLALYNLAELSRRAGQQGDAEEFARRALDVAANANDTDSVNASRLQIGMTLSDIGRYDEAVTELTAVLRNVDPSSEEYAGAVHSLANIELGRGDVDSALRHYRTAVDHEARETIQATESLLGYAEALAASGKRRLFNRIFQRAIDSIDAVPYTNDLALRFTQIARRWARANKSRFAGEALATAILLPASVGQQRFKTAASDGADSVLEEAMFSVGAEIYYQTEIEPMGDVQLLLDATQMELRRLANASVAREAVRALRRIAKAMKAAD